MQKKEKLAAQHRKSVSKQKFTDASKEDTLCEWAKSAHNAVNIAPFCHQNFQVTHNGNGFAADVFAGDVEQNIIECICVMLKM